MIEDLLIVDVWIVGCVILSIGLIIHYCLVIEESDLGVENSLLWILILGA